MKYDENLTFYEWYKQRIWDLKNVSADMDECATGRHTCNSREECHNTVGGYSCLAERTGRELHCDEGYSYSEETNTCQG